MKDLDFDELDKAVSSLMKTVPETPPPIDSTSTTQQPAPASTVPVAAKLVVTAPSTPAAAPAELAKSPSNLAEKRPGRFMDVMHSSSDMRASQQRPLPATRQGVSLSPINPSVAPEASSKPTQKPAASETPVSTPYPEKDVNTSQIDTSWPDPIDMQALHKEEPAAPKVDSTPSPTVPTQPQPTSPFLADAKVEKRPLGGAGGNSSSDTPEVKPDRLAVAATDASPSVANIPDINVVTPDQDKDKNTTNQIPLPAELGQEITAIEADSSSRHPAKESSPQTTLHTEPASFITKQYKEKESTGEKDHAAIYDNNTQPLAHPAKKKSGWGAVILILVLILLGGGGAAVLFFFGII